ncbi:MAG: hypothetical protein HUU50_13755 [Candidatus Brocadiae bacterium]|nr:hypothetical protein [Candidatus Brocadiia bacterium]
MLKFYFLSLFLLSFYLNSQVYNIIEEGIGETLELALQMAKKHAIAKTLGEEIKNFSKMENFKITLDLVTAESSSWIKSEILEKRKEKNHWYVKIKCQVMPKISVLLKPLLENRFNNKLSPQSLQSLFRYQKGILLDEAGLKNINILENQFLLYGFRLIKNKISQENIIKIKNIIKTKKSETLLNEFFKSEPYDFVISIIEIQGMIKVEFYNAYNGEIYAIASAEKDSESCVENISQEIFPQLYTKIIETHVPNIYTISFRNFTTKEIRYIRKKILSLNSENRWARLQAQIIEPEVFPISTYLQFETCFEKNMQDFIDEILTKELHLELGKDYNGNFLMNFHFFFRY